MKKALTKLDNWLGGLQWLMFIFVNTVVVPITIGAAFDLSQEQVVSTMQFSFILGGIACLLQVLVGYERPIMNGPSGLWWGVIIALSSMAAAQGVPISEVGGSIAVGVLLTGVFTILVGVTGFGYYLEKLFNPSVMGVFMLLFGVSLCINFMKGMLGIPFGGQTGEAKIDIGPSILAILIAGLVLILTIKASNKVAQYAMLIGIVVGWPLFALLFNSESQLGSAGVSTSLNVFFFPAGEPSWNIGI